MRLIVVAAGVMLMAALSAPVFALQPCPQDIDEYRQFLDSELRQRTPGRTIATFLAMPSFEPESAVVLSEADGKPTVSVVRFTQSVWYGSVEEFKPHTYHHVFSASKVTAKTQHFSASTELASLLQSLLAKEIGRRDATSSGGFDGETYTFTLVDAGCAQTWSPDSGTRNQMLVQTFEEVGGLAGIFTNTLRRYSERRLVAKLKTRWGE